MRIPMEERRILIKTQARVYQKGGKKEKTSLLDHFVEATGYNRVYAARVLRSHGRCCHVGRGVFVQAEAAGCFNRGRGREYGAEVVEPLRRVWEWLDYLCGKRLVEAIPGALESLERHGELELKEETRRKLLKMSAATMDRVLAPEKEKYVLRGRTGTKPGSLLKSQISVRTFADWNEEEPGFVEIDLVGHDGGSSQGDYVQTLDMTDVQTGWSEQRAVLNKAQKWVFEALLQLKSRLPFPLMGIDSDNGGEFINQPLLEYCQEQQITFTRSRPYRKNDTCYVEQKNYSIVRRAVGYGRFVGPKAVERLNRLYDLLRLRTNYFLPSTKLEAKNRIGSRVQKHYQVPKTPYQRVLESPQISESIKQELRREYDSMNLAQLDREIRKVQTDLGGMVRQVGIPNPAKRQISLGNHQWKKGLPFPASASVACSGERRMAPVEKGKRAPNRNGNGHTNPKKALAKHRKRRRLSDTF